MKRVIQILILVGVLLLIVGCLPPKPGDDAEEVVEAPVESAKPAPKPALPEPVVEVVAENITENVTIIEPEISGSTKLQNDLGLCPYLAREFDCDRYDVRGCKPKQNLGVVVGEKGFFPDYVHCRTNNPGERHDSRFCFIQECSPLAESGIVKGYGGMVAYAEYDYTLEKTGTGIMTNYKLLKCGLLEMEFDDQFECQTYYSEWRALWD
ncbi:hypothetical protein ACFL0V_04735 [Nanoarchaeota archaeon]